MASHFDIDALEGIRTYLDGWRRYHVPTMNHFRSEDARGFWHQQQDRAEASLSSSATCASSLVRAALWRSSDRKWPDSKTIVQRLLEKPWKSADLKANNPFSISFIAQGVLDLTDDEPYAGCDADRNVVFKKIAPLLIKEVASGYGHLAVPGSVSIDPYPASAYLTQLAFRILIRTSGSSKKFASLRQDVKGWARGEIYRQLALISANSRIADPLQMAYAVIVLGSASMDEQNSPEEMALMRQALKVFFQNQLQDGTWPPSQPLFHYPRVGNAHAFDYELLTELLRCDALQDELLQYMENFDRAARHLESTAFELGPNAFGWASGHHPQIEGPESWSTASVYDFIHAFDRLVAEGVRRALFEEVGGIYNPPERPDQLPSSREFAPTFLDACVTVDGKTLSLRETLRDYFVLPIDRERANVANGQRFQDTTPMSAILFGPPGTSKTQLAKLIGRYLGWPVLSIDPSYLVQDGLDRLYARANRLFTMLALTEQVVVLLDEFDELGRDRSQSPELLSRFITTSMLPKLALINQQRKIVFLLATNYVSDFDAAFSRRGRFDMMLQVLPPTAEAKCKHGPWSAPLTSALAGLTDKKRRKAEEALEDLTYLETQQLVVALQAGVADPLAEILAAREKGTLNQKIGSKTWKKTSADEEKLSRLPPVTVTGASPVT